MLIFYWILLNKTHVIDEIDQLILQSPTDGAGSALLQQLCTTISFKAKAFKSFYKVGLDA